MALAEAQQGNELLSEEERVALLQMKELAMRLESKAKVQALAWDLLMRKIEHIHPLTHEILESHLHPLQTHKNVNGDLIVNRGGQPSYRSIVNDTIGEPGVKEGVLKNGWGKVLSFSVHDGCHLSPADYLQHAKFVSLYLPNGLPHSKLQTEFPPAMERFYKETGVSYFRDLPTYIGMPHRCVRAVADFELTGELKSKRFIDQETLDKALRFFAQMITFQFCNEDYVITGPMEGSVDSNQVIVDTRNFSGIITDPDLLFASLYNLMSNAAKELRRAYQSSSLKNKVQGHPSKPEGAKIIVRLESKGGNVLIKVEDSGRGIDKEALVANFRKAIETNALSVLDLNGHALDILRDSLLTDDALLELAMVPGVSGFMEKLPQRDISNSGIGLPSVKYYTDIMGGRLTYAGKSKTLGGASMNILLPYGSSEDNALGAHSGVQKRVDQISFGFQEEVFRLAM